MRHEQTARVRLIYVSLLFAGGAMLDGKFIATNLQIDILLNRFPSYGSMLLFCTVPIAGLMALQDTVTCLSSFVFKWYYGRKEGHEYRRLERYYDLDSDENITLPCGAVICGGLPFGFFLEFSRGTADTRFIVTAFAVTALPVILQLVEYAGIAARQTQNNVPDG